MTQQTTHPLTSGYLAELERLLSGLPAAEREEVLAGVREHLGDVAAEGGGDAAVRQAITELGPPEVVADEAYAGHPSIARPRPTLARGWVPVVVAVLLGLGTLSAVAVVGGMAGYGTSSSTTSSSVAVAPSEPGSTSESRPDEQAEVTTTSIDFSYPSPVMVLVAMVGTAPIWIGGVILAALSPLWRRRERWTLTAFVPFATIITPTLTSLGWALSHREIGINLGAWVALALALGCGIQMIRLCHRGSQRVVAN